MTENAEQSEVEPQEIALAIDFSGEDLTLNERIAVEDACDGRAFEDLRLEGRSTFLRAVAWVVMRRHDPRSTIDEAGDLVVRFEVTGG